MDSYFSRYQSSRIRIHFAGAGGTTRQRACGAQATWSPVNRTVIDSCGLFKDVFRRMIDIPTSFRIDVTDGLERR
jgi:hypothetical protein